MAASNAINNRSSTLTVDSGLTVTAGNAVVTAGNITLPNTNAAGTEGEITFGGIRYISNYQATSFFAGYESGNTAVTGASNSCFGYRTGKQLALGHHNTLIGTGSGLLITDGANNVGVGANAFAISGATGLTTGSDNIAIGLTALARVATGTNNIAIGSSAGSALTLADSSNVMISNGGTAGNSNTIKIGTQGAGAGQQDSTYIAGITGTATGVTTEIVQIDSTGKLGTISATTINLSADATATTVNLATGAAAKVVTLGSTNGASSLALKYGTADFTLASVTGTVMSALDTGEITKPLQPCFMAFNSATDADVTGDATVFTLIFDGERYDQNADWDGTSTFTASATGKYFFDVHVYTQGIAAGHTAGFIYFVTSNRTYYCWSLNPAAVCAGTGMFTGTVLADMDVGDTCQVKIRIDNSTKVIDIYGAATGEYTNFSGSLVC